jgi:hypothetical protein
MRTALILSLCFLITGNAFAESAPNGASAAAEEVELPPPPKVWAYGFGGVALGLWLVAAGTGGGALALQSEQEGSVANPMPYTQGIKDDNSTGQTLALTSYVFIALASVATVVDAVLWFECFRKSRKIEKQRSASVPRRHAAVEFTGNGVRF